MFKLISVIFFGLSVQAANVTPSLIGGDVVPPEKYPAVIWLSGCSATLIGPRVVLTAGHCDGLSGTLELNGQKYQLSLSANPRYKRFWEYTSPLGDNSDLALGVFDKDVVGIAPMSIGGEAKTSSEVILLGWGCTEKFGGGNQEPDRQLHEGKNLIYRADNSGMLLKGLRNGASGCPGDSGGPTFIKTSEGLRVLGVHSQVAFDRQNGGRLPETWDARTDLQASREYFHNFAATNHVEICGVTTKCR